MGVGVVIIEIIVHRLDDCSWDLRSAGAVKIRDRIAVVHTLECGKVTANFFDCCDAGFLLIWLCHILDIIRTRVQNGILGTNIEQNDIIK